MDKVYSIDERYAQEIVRLCKSKEEVIDRLLEFDYPLAKHNNKDLEVNSVSDILWNRILERNKPLKESFSVRGVIKSREFWVNSEKLDFNKSKIDFNLTHANDFYWGEPGTVNGQLSFAILMALTKNKDRALKHYVVFKSEVVDTFPEADLEMLIEIDYQ